MRWKAFGIRLAPQIVYNVPNDALQGGVALMLQTYIPLNKKWRIAADVFLMGSWLRFKTHDRSIMQARVGPMYENLIQFGISYDLDQYSSRLLRQQQLGIFVSTNF